MSDDITSNYIHRMEAFPSSSTLRDMTEMNSFDGSVNTHYPDLYSTLNVNYCWSTCRVGGYRPRRTKPSTHSVLHHATITVLLISKISFLHTIHIVPRCCAPKPLLPQQTGHYTTCCKKSQSCAPEDGQKFARHMLS